ncbi:hypothetical protein PHAVU_008G056300 [Phaseolus vulgaris]|uniref:Uncharacterized protein n=1 Tax=Phaseolus vulgaris TaxID=3885 RepID=V7B1Q7_PHAVU|nr:hypothetical protein PHAVU_008G056300g [Phaseolus vulgaris]ESW11744.1 hypothetical protein PHAVU_008G056300g [Phaseolus vulgaris]
MASFTLVTSLPKFGHAGAIIARARAWNPRFFAATTPRSIQVPSSPEGSAAVEGTKQGAGETVNNSLNESTQDKAFTTAQHVSHKTDQMANQVSANAQNMAERAKQTMQDAWDSTKNTANRAKDTVVAKSQESAEYVKENAEAVKNNMNSKN